MKKTVALTGASGNMGVEILTQIMESPYLERLKIILLDNKRERKLARKWHKQYGDRIEIIFGNIANRQDCDKLVADTDYVFNTAGVIPPVSDHFPIKSKLCNLVGAMNIADAVAAIKVNQPKLVHTSTVAIYGNRNYLHPWGRVGDPLLPSVYDSYAAHKLRGERYVIDSEVQNWAVVRQTAMLHMKMLTNNMKDGLMFHTCYNVPLEWVTARDSGRLFVKIFECDCDGKANGFWKKVYNIGGGAANRITGYETFDMGFKIIGCSADRLMRPTWNSLRNFHGMWFSDGEELEKLFHYQTETVEDYWQEILKRHPYYRVAKILPPSLISKLAIQRLLGDENAPRKWVSTGNLGKVRAYFGSMENLEYMPSNWNAYPLLAKGQVANDDIDYENMKDITKIEENGYLLSHGYDESKPDAELDIHDMQDAAAFRGGRCLSEHMNKGDLYTKLLCQIIIIILDTD